MCERKPPFYDAVFSPEELELLAPTSKRLQRLILRLSEYMTVVDMCMGRICEAPRTLEEQVDRMPCEICGRNEWLLEQFTPEIQRVILEKIYAARRRNPWGGKKYLGV